MQDLFLCGEAEPGKSGQSLNYLCRAINRLEADVICLQEVGSLASLARLNDKLKTPFPYVYCVDGNSNRSICLAYLSRWPLTLETFGDQVLADTAGEGLQEYPDAIAAHSKLPQSAKMQRDIAFATIQLSASCNVELLNLHLKSPVTRDWMLTSAAEIRAAEIRLLVAVLQQRPMQHNVTRVIAGDLNGLLTSPEFSPLHNLGIVDPIGLALRQAGRNPSTYWPKRRCRIDHLLLQSCASEQTQVVNATVHVNPEARKASDHYPVSIDLVLVDEPNS